MKKIVLLFILPVVMILSCSKTKVTPTVTQTDLALSNLPAKISTYVQDNYPDASIYQAVVLTNSTAKYVVILTTDEELAFDNNSNFIGNGHGFPGPGDPSDCGGPGHHGGGPGGDHHHGHGHPGNFIPPDSLSSAIKAFIAANYPDYTTQNGQKDTLCPAGAITSVMLEKSDTIHLKLFFGEGDVFLMTGMRIHFAGVPQAIKDYIQTNYADYHVCPGTEILTLADNSVQYAVYVDKEHMRTRLVLSADGTVVCSQVLPHHPC